MNLRRIQCGQMYYLLNKLQKREETFSAVSRLTWTDAPIVHGVMHKVQQSCTIQQMSMERGFAENPFFAI